MAELTEAEQDKLLGDQAPLAPPPPIEPDNELAAELEQEKAS